MKTLYRLIAVKPTPGSSLGRTTQADGLSSREAAERLKSSLATARTEALTTLAMLTRQRHEGDLAIDEPADLDTIRTLFGEGSALHRLAVR